MARGGPGRSHRVGLSLVGLQDRFPDEAAAEKWFIEQRWPNGRHYPRCGSTKTADRGGVLKYWCPDCRRRFSVRTGTVLERSKIPLRKWAIAIYLHVTSLSLSAFLSCTALQRVPIHRVSAPESGCAVGYKNPI